MTPLHASLSLVSPLASTVAHPLDVTHSYCFLSVHCHHLRSGTTISFLANCSIFTMFSLPSVFPSWFCSKWIRQALGSDCLSLYPDLGPLSVPGNHSTSFMVLWGEKEHIIHVKASQHLLNWVEPKPGLTPAGLFTINPLSITGLWSKWTINCFVLFFKDFIFIYLGCAGS